MMTPEEIIERHQKHPRATADLIDRCYADVKLFKHIDDLLKYSSITHLKFEKVNMLTIVCANEFWEKFVDIDTYKLIDINMLEVSDKKAKEAGISDEITPEKIVKRHEVFSLATAELIRHYSNVKTKRYIDSMISQCAVRSVDLIGVLGVVISCKYEIFENVSGSSNLDGKKIETLQVS